MSFKLECVRNTQPALTLANTPPINALPQEIIENIFSYLGKRDLQSSVCANKRLGDSVLASVNYNEPASIKMFISRLLVRLDPKKFHNQKDFLIQVSQNITTQKFLNLRLLKEYVLQVKMSLVSVIKTLDVKIVTNPMFHIKPPHFMENIFELAILDLSEESRSIYTFRGISQALTHAGNFDRAIDFATSIPYDDERAYALRDISVALANAGNFDKAIELAASLRNESQRGVALHFISKAFVDAGNFDKAIELAASLSNESERAVALRNISNALTNVGQIDRAIELAGSILNELWRGVAFHDISKALAHAGNIDRAIEATASIPNEYKRGSALQDISKVLTDAGNINRAIELSNKAWALQDIKKYQ